MITQAEINHIVQGFQKQTLPKEEWTHQAHLINGLYYVMAEGVEESVQLMRDGVKRYNLSVGTQNTDTGGYHESITIFFMHALDAFQQQHSEDASFVDLVKRFESMVLRRAK